MAPRNVSVVNAATQLATANPNVTQAAAALQPVDEWIAKQASFTWPILHHLRALVHEAVPECTEHIKWSRPFFLVNGTPIAHMAAFKQHCGFGFWSAEMTAVLAADGIAEPGASGSFGRIRSVADLPPRETLLRYIRHAAELAQTGTGGAAAPETRRTSAKAPIPEPPEFTAALSAATLAKANFDGMAPSCRREYLQWIAGAKRAETRERRVLQAIAMLTENKRFDEQYRTP